ncbi:MAG: PqqD family protein [Clostridia bacterium]|nr:PqqD family protein [Clostridia bacterium]
MKVEKNVILREIAGEYILIPTGSMALKFTGVFTVNELGVAVWNLLVQGKKEDEIVTSLLQEYDVEKETLAADVRDFLRSLREKELLHD